MLVFRKIRKQLASENKVWRYLRYAVGEIILIVLGIIIALQLQNYNQRKTQEQRFNAYMDRVYRDIWFSHQKYSKVTNEIRENVKVLDLLRKNPDIIPDQNLPYALIFSMNESFYPLQSEAYLLQADLNIDPDNEQQVAISQQIASYMEEIRGNPIAEFEIDGNVLTDYLYESGVLFPDLLLKWDVGFGFDPDLEFKPEQTATLREDLNSGKLKDVLSVFVNQKILKYSQLLVVRNLGAELLNQLKIYKPDLRVYFEDVGIIGDALNGWEVPSTPMEPLGENRSVWVAELECKAGQVKFRVRDSWLVNWGGKNFPQGELVPDGPNLTVEPGRYRITLDLETNSYSFEPLN